MSKPETYQTRLLTFEARANPEIKTGIRCLATPICPECGSHETWPHYKGTFDFDGWICLACGCIFPGPDPGAKGPRIRIKTWKNEHRYEDTRRTEIKVR